MSHLLLVFIALLSPITFLITALLSFYQPGLRPTLVKRAAVAATLIGIFTAVLYGVLLVNHRLIQIDLTTIENLGLLVRIDSLSAIMFGMIALLSFIIVRYSLNYLDGDERQGVFIGRLAATVAAVQLLVLSGHLVILFIAWVLTSVSLHRLLLFYPNRPGAAIAAKKKFILARLGDACLFIAGALLYQQFNTGNLEIIFTTIKTSHAIANPNVQLELAALFLAAAAVLKSAQFPTHGWLIEVMETPTPVSALLHAGLLNAGPFLIIRMAFVMEASVYAHVVLIVIGGFTALFASIVYLTQTSVKTALGYSSVAHMGFSLLVCGLGVYSAALLHLVSHSFYKAHAFLSSGSVIDVMRASKTSGLKRLGSPLRITLGIVMAIGVYAVFIILWPFESANQFSLLAIGAVIMMGLSRIFTSAIDSKQSVSLLLPASLLGLTVIAAFFVLEAGTHMMMLSQLPETVSLSIGIKVLVVLIVLAFGLVVIVQIGSPLSTPKPIYRIMAIHFRNGFYANALFDRFVGALKIDASSRALPIPITQTHARPMQAKLEV